MRIPAAKRMRTRTSSRRRFPMPFAGGRLSALSQRKAFAARETAAKNSGGREGTVTNIDKKTLRGAAVCLGVICAMYMVFHYVYLPSYHIPTVAISGIVLSTVFLSWGLSILRRFSQKQMRLHLLTFVASCVLLMLLRTAKFAFVSQNSALQRHLWYAYYIPFVFGPAALFSASMFLGKPDDAKTPKSQRAVYLISLLLSAGILTNDLHGLAFRFAPGFADWQNNYTHGPLYYLAAAWMLLCGLCMIANAMRTAFIRRPVKTAWLPILVLAAEFAGSFVMFIEEKRLPIFLTKMELQEYVCLSCIVFWESLVIARIIPDNNDYPELFAASSLRAGIADNTYRVQQISENGVRPAPEELRRALDGDVVLQNDDTLLKAHAVRGGLFYWTEDISALRQLNQALEETADYFEEENATMRLTAEIDESRRRTVEQNQIYDRVTQVLLPQLDALGAWIEVFPEEETAFCEALRKIGVLLAFCKRQSNLLLHTDDDPLLTGAELLPCFEESAKALRVAGVCCAVSVEPSVNLSTRNASVLYRWFETVVERMLPVLGSVAVSLCTESDATCIRMDAEPVRKTEPEMLSSLAQTLRETEQEVANANVRFALRVKHGEGFVCV